MTDEHKPKNEVYQGPPICIIETLRAHKDLAENPKSDHNVQSSGITNHVNPILPDKQDGKSTSIINIGFSVISTLLRPIYAGLALGLVSVVVYVFHSVFIGLISTVIRVIGDLFSF